MPYPHYQRLTAADEAFLDVEGQTTPMHIGAVCLYDLAPLQHAVHSRAPEIATRPKRTKRHTTRRVDRLRAVARVDTV